MNYYNLAWLTPVLFAAVLFVYAGYSRWRHKRKVLGEPKVMCHFCNKMCPVSEIQTFKVSGSLASGEDDMISSCDHCEGRDLP